MYFIISHFSSFLSRFGFLHNTKVPPRDVGGGWMSPTLWARTVIRTPPHETSPETRCGCTRRAQPLVVSAFHLWFPSLYRSSLHCFWPGLLAGFCNNSSLKAISAICPDLLLDRSGRVTTLLISGISLFFNSLIWQGNLGQIFSRKAWDFHKELAEKCKLLLCLASSAAKSMVTLWIWQLDELLGSPALLEWGLLWVVVYSASCPYLSF